MGVRFKREGLLLPGAPIRFEYENCGGTLLFLRTLQVRRVPVNCRIASLANSRTLVGKAERFRRSLYSIRARSQEERRQRGMACMQDRPGVIHGAGAASSAVILAGENPPVAFRETKCLSCHPTLSHFRLMCFLVQVWSEMFWNQRPVCLLHGDFYLLIW